MNAPAPNDPILPLQYDNKYRLWTDLVRGNTDRIFVAAAAPPPLHTDVILAVTIGDAPRPRQIVGTVVGVRQGSKRFATGVYVHIPAVELVKLRKALELRPAERRYDEVRHTSRVHYEIPVRLPEADPDAACITRNLSLGGLFLTGTDALVNGDEIDVELLVEPRPITLRATVAWCDAQQRAAGLRFIELTAPLQAQIADLIEQGREVAAMHGDRPIPVVVADDEEDIAKFIGNALAKHGYEVYRAATGDETLALVRELHPALLLLDILMPRMDGSEVCKIMRADVDLATIPVVFISALDPPSLHAVADECGATDYLSKPVRLAETLQMVGQYLHLEPFPPAY